jgi:uncharacterized protein (TIGR02147 family)
MAKQSLSVFDYIDYRRYLKAFYSASKESTRRFSHRALAMQLGFASPNFLKLVMDGQRNVGKESLGKITQGLGLNKQESEYFSYLVFFAQAKNTVDKNYYFGLVAALRARKNVASLTPDQFEYFSEWYHPAIRELLCGKTEPLDYASLSGKLITEISGSKFRKSVELLKRLGLIRLDENNTYQCSTPLLNTENELNSFAVRRYHAEVLGVAKHALETVAPQEREFSHVTVATSAAGFTKLKKRMQEFREEILQIVAEESRGEEIYHVNLQVYPIVKSDDHE